MVTVVDTVKRELGDQVVTVDRQGLWRALTPQVFGFAQLRQALKEYPGKGGGTKDFAQGSLNDATQVDAFLGRAKQLLQG